MRKSTIAATLLAFATPAMLTAQDAPAVEPYSTADTEIGRLLADPAARAVLQKHIPSIVQGRAAEQVAHSTIKAIQGYALFLLPDAKLAAIDADLAKLTPLPPPPGYKPLRSTTNEAKVRPYVLPDPLVLANGKPVRDARTWWSKRRPEIVRMFETLEYGRAPGRPKDMRFDVFDKGTPALGGKAIRKQVEIRFAKDPAAPTLQLVQYLPAAAKKPVPVLLMIGFSAPSAMIDDPGIRKSLVWDPAKKVKVPATSSPMGRFDVAKFLDAGIGVVTYNYTDVDPDFPGGYKLGIRGFLDGGEEADRKPDAWGSIAAWAWSLSRVQDYLESDPAVDAKRVALHGASRLGKTVMWASARDQRFAVVTACCDGKMGAGLMRRNFGESISSANSGAVAHWVAPAFARFYDNEDATPMDGHMLLALIAPRPVFLQTGMYDHAADPKGEFLSAVAAGPVYRLLGKQDLGTASWPPAGPILNDIGYYVNPRIGHGMGPGDWDVYLAFLKKHLRPGG